MTLSVHFRIKCHCDFIRGTWSRHFSIRRHSEDARKTQFTPLVRCALTFTSILLYIYPPFHSKCINCQEIWHGGENLSRTCRLEKQRQKISAVNYVVALSHQVLYVYTYYRIYPVLSRRRDSDLVDLPMSRHVYSTNSLHVTCKMRDFAFLEDITEFFIRDFVDKSSRNLSLSKKIAESHFKKRVISFFF